MDTTSSASRRNRTRTATLEALEERLALSGAGGPQVINLTHLDTSGGTALVVQFDEAMNPARAGMVSEYALVRPGRDEVYGTGDDVRVPLTSATYNASQNSVTLAGSRRLASGAFYRLTIEGRPGVGLTGADGVLMDGDADQTPGGDYRNLIGWGKSLSFADSQGDAATIRVTSAGQAEVLRQINGDVEVLRILNPSPYRTTLSGKVRKAPGGDGQVVIPTLSGANEVINTLAGPAFQIPQAPLAATANFPYTIKIDPVSLPSAPTLQSMSAAQADGKWLMIGGRTNGLHNFDGVTPTNPDGGFPRRFENRNIVVIDPATGQTWARAWSDTGVSTFVADSLASTNHQSYQDGNKLYITGGYGLDQKTGQFVTFDTLTSIDVPAMIRAVIDGGDVAATLRQVRDPRLAVTGGEMAAIGKTTYLVFGQDFEGLYTGSGSNISQVYNNTIASFTIVDTPKRLGIANYAARIDPVNYHRRDYNLATFVYPDGHPGLMGLGGVFTPSGLAYLNPVFINDRGRATIDFNYQQFFSQYDSPKITLFNGRDRSSQTVLLGGISLTDYNPATGQFTQDTELPFVSDVSTIVRQATGATQEYALTARLPYLLGADAAFFAAPGVPSMPNGAVRLDKIHGPTVLGTMFGGILAEQPNFGSSTATALAYRITLVPNPGRTGGS